MYFKLTASLLESSTGKHDWHLHYLGEISQLYHISPSQILVILKEKSTIAVLTNGTYMKKR